jgi:hypothetical protein
MSVGTKAGAWRVLLFAIALSVLCVHVPDRRSPLAAARQAQTSLQFGGDYASLDARRQALVSDWVARFNELTGEKAEPALFYDTKVVLSARITFDAVTNALLTTTDTSGEKYGDALDLVERVETVQGQILGARGDRQFRMYVRLKEGAVDRLDRAQEFRRGADNTIYHKGYPLNYRQQGGTPSTQISVALDHRRADIDVDYRSSSFPAAVFNGHLTAANSDVRAGNNYERHTNRWSGFQNWWRSIFGIRVGSNANPPEKVSGIIPPVPRAGNKAIEVMVEDFLEAWLIDGDIPGALSYISDRSYACLAENADDRGTFDRGMAPFQLRQQLSDAHKALGKHDSLEGLVVGVRLTKPGLKIVTQPHHAQFVLYAVPDDIAAAFDCESRQTLADPARVRRQYGQYYGATFFIDGRQEYSIALLWAKDRGHWRIVSWQAQPEDDEGPHVETPTVAAAAGPARKADPALAAAAKGFLESWLIRKQYDAAFKYLSPASYGCYNLTRSADSQPAASPAEAARLLRAALEHAGTEVGRQTRLDTLLSSVEPVHPGVRVLAHPDSATFALLDVPNAIVAVAGCESRTRGDRLTGDIALQYGDAYGMTFRFKTRSGETPVLRMLWVREDGAWRITTYDVEHP